MKKWVIRIIIGLVVLALLTVLAIGMFLDSGIKRGIETAGSMLTKATVKLDGVSLSFLSGSGKIKGLLVGNPQGFNTPSSIKVGSASLAVQPSSIFSDKVVIKSILVEGPEITYETNLKQSNLGKLVSNLQEATGGVQSSRSTVQPPGAGKEPSSQAAKKASKKLQVDEFVITGAKVNVSVTALGSQPITVPLTDIHINDLGKGPEGITAAELVQKVLEALEKGAAQASSSSVADLTKQASALTKDASETVNSAEKAAKGIGDLFNKKK